MKNLVDYSNIQACRLNAAEQFRTARAYRSALASFSLFLGETPQWKHLCSATLKRYELYLNAKELALNTVSFYMRNLRAVYNRAVKDKIVRQRRENPFAEVFTGNAKTEKRALETDEMQRLTNPTTAAANTQILNATADQSFALQLFQFAFFAQGMSFVDMVFLKKSDRKDSQIVYRRRKTGTEVRVAINEPMRKIIDDMAAQTQDSPYIFPIIKVEKGNEYLQYQSALSKQNRLLKQVGQMCGIEKTFSTHAARHSWASFARTLEIPLTVISEALGHSSEKTTQIYLNSLNFELISQANYKIAACFCKKQSMLT